MSDPLHNEIEWQLAERDNRVSERRNAAADPLDMALQSSYDFLMSIEIAARWQKDANCLLIQALRKAGAL